VTVPAGRATRVARRSGALAATAALVGLSTLAAHQVSYLATSRSAEAYAATMSATGHDSVWLPLVATVLVALTLVTFVTSRRLLDLSARAGRGGRRHVDVPLRDFAGMVGSLWPRFAAATTVAYAIQENVERVLAGRTPPGLDALIAHGSIPIFVIVLSSLVVAAVTALVRWRARILVARIRSGSAFTRHAPVGRPRPDTTRPRARAWRAATASRAPPVAAPAA
jgi:hypothetical protein